MKSRLFALPGPKDQCSRNVPFNTESSGLGTISGIENGYLAVAMLLFTQFQNRRHFHLNVYNWQNLPEFVSSISHAYFHEQFNGRICVLAWSLVLADQVLIKF